MPRLSPVVLVALCFSLPLVACGSCDDEGRGRLPDAPMITDTPPDMMPPTPQPVTLTVTRNRVAVADVRVYFQAADNMLVKSTTTDATGTASALMEAGGYVTAIDPFFVNDDQLFGGFDHVLRTFAGVKPGDHLLLTLDFPDSVEFTLNAKSVEGATDYEVFTSCGSTSIPPGGGGSGSGADEPGGQVTLFGCSGIADIAIVASRFDGESPRQLLGGVYHAGATVANEVTVTLTEDYTDLVDRTFTYLNVPGERDVSLSHSLVTAHGRIGPFEDSDFGGSTTLTEPPVTATGVVIASSLFLDGNARHHVVDWGNPTNAYTLDMTGLLLPDLTEVPSYDPDAKKVTWMQGAGAVPDFTVTTLNVRRLDGKSFQRWDWRIAGPYVAGEIKYPVLPDTFDWSPGEGEADVQDFRLVKVVGGYDAARARVHDIAERGQVTGFVAGATGRAVISELAFFPARQVRR